MWKLKPFALSSFTKKWESEYALCANTNALCIQIKITDWGWALPFYACSPNSRRQGTSLEGSRQSDLTMNFDLHKSAATLTLSIQDVVQFWQNLQQTDFFLQYSFSLLLNP
jgi:hypothetical protein